MYAKLRAPSIIRINTQFLHLGILKSQKLYIREGALVREDALSPALLCIDYGLDRFD
jgi:hypothetical protein